eukprot:TRINITY_DN12097_c0_g1_i1.p1 TRINITY_DN12097_c0_g1~~TRINITY_DN12097_c0_g1_i1.p1  ORF type:complete len:145 (-),score=7.10 TRINITY_DN12097_c0_g1_i1:123-536(-)
MSDALTLAEQVAACDASFRSLLCQTLKELLLTANEVTLEPVLNFFLENELEAIRTVVKTEEQMMDLLIDADIQSHVGVRNSTALCFCIAEAVTHGNCLCWNIGVSSGLSQQHSHTSAREVRQDVTDSDSSYEKPILL